MWQLDTNTVIVKHYIDESGTFEEKTYTADCVRYHLHYSASKYPDRLRKLVSNGKIIEYLDELETSVNDALNRQGSVVKTLKKYQFAVLNGDTDKAKRLENSLFFMARESVFECMVYV